jgi:phosphoribosyl 1,2-cyclic phosphate phosphodiesterase
LFVEGPNLLFDTTEEVSLMLNRAGVSQVDGIAYTHWHPDHTAGWRILEQMGATADGSPPQTIPVYIPQTVWRDFERREQLGMAANLKHLARCGWARIEILEDERPIGIGGVRLEAIPIKGATANVYAFLLERGTTRMLLAPDHLLDWRPPARLAGADVAVLEAGWFAHGSDGARINLEEGITTTKTPFEETLRLVRELKARHTFLTHIQEYYGWTYDDYAELRTKLADDYPNLIFAYDGLVVNLV